MTKRERLIKEYEADTKAENDRVRAEAVRHEVARLKLVALANEINRTPPSEPDRKPEPVIVEVEVHGLEGIERAISELEETGDRIARHLAAVDPLAKAIAAACGRISITGAHDRFAAILRAEFGPR